MKEDGNSSATWNSTNSVIDVTYKGYETTINPNTGTMTALAKINSSSQDNSSNNNNNNNNNSSLVTITSQNVSDYLGKIVTNYKTPNSTEQITIDGNTYTVSTTYRLYYVDFDNKYGDGAGTIYLKADITDNGYRLCDSDTYEVFTGNLGTSKIENLNPLLYSNENYQPNNSRDKIKAITWLLDSSKWSELLSLNTAIANKTKYIVGAPSVEMMMDSYNTYYGLTDLDIDYSQRTSETTSRTKLLYDVLDMDNQDDFEYIVGPIEIGYGGDDTHLSLATGGYVVLPDSEVGTMYLPSGERWGWLASPTDYYSGDEVILTVNGFDGSVGERCMEAESSFHPVVALDSDVQLEFAE